MATPYERAFVQHLTVLSSLERVVEDGLPVDTLADDGLRQIYQFALDYYHDDHLGGAAPSSDALKLHFGNILAENEIDTDFDPTDSLDWALKGIRGAYADRKWGTWVRDFATDMSAADLLAKPEVLTAAMEGLMQLQTALTRKTEMIDVRSGMESRVAAYQTRERERETHGLRGIRLGMRQVDEHTNGIWPGELGIFAGGPKSGKSFALAHSALAHWEAGGTPVLYTLENGVEMTQDRLACMALHIDARRFARGELTDAEKHLMQEWINVTIRSKDRPFWIIQPEPGKRTVQSMVRQAKTLGDALYIDQLTFVDVPSSSERSPRNIQVRDILHDLKALISSGHRIACLLAHQINREGVKAAEKTGKLEMHHMAEAAEVERTADWLFGLWQGEGLRAGQAAYLQLLAARREDLASWQLTWAPHLGRIGVLGPIDLRGV